MWILFFIILTLCLFLLPLVPSILELKYPTSTNPMRVIQEHDGDIRYFAVSFKRFLEKHFSMLIFSSSQQSTRLVEGIKNKTKYQIIGKNNLPLFDEKELEANATSKLIIAKDTLPLQGGIFYETEIYSAKSIMAAPASQFRALLAEGNITLGEGCTILRWIHSNKSIHIAADCTMYGRTSAEEEIIINGNCYFERMHAAKIIFGNEIFPANLKKCKRIALESLPNIKEKYKKRWLIEGDMELPEKSFYEGNLIATGNVLIGADSHIKGDIKSNEDMRIDARTHIEGSIVSVGNIYIDVGCHIDGPIISEGKIIINEGVSIGLESQPTSICAPNIEIMNEVITYGSIRASEKALVTTKGGGLK